MAAGAAGLANVMNQSLSPTKLNPSNPLSPSNYPDKKSVVAAYKRMVRYRVDFRILVLYGSLMSIEESFKMAIKRYPHLKRGAGLTFVLPRVL